MSLVVLVGVGSIRMRTFEKMRAKWFGVCMVVSRFFFFRTKMNFAENKK
jgi:hypothetical protein